MTARRTAGDIAKDISGSIEDLVERGWQQQVYPYEDLNGTTVYEKVYLELYDSRGVRISQTFRHRRYDRDGNPVENLDGISPVPYRLCDICSDADKPIWVVDGEKCADALAATGRIAISVAEWTDHTLFHFWTRDVVLVPDNGSDGAALAGRAVAALRPLVKSVQVARLPVLNPAFAEGWNVAEFLACGGNIADIESTFTTLDRAQGPIWWDKIEIGHNARYLVKGILHPGDFASIYGESYAGKSHLALDIALSVAAGKPWNGHRVQQCAVLYIALEGWRGFKNRVVARRRRFAGQRVPLAVWPTSFDLSDANNTDFLIEAVQKLASEGSPIGMIVIDTLARAIGTADENSGQGMGLIVANSARIQEATGACVVWVHHVGKDAGRGPRGHSSLFAALDTGIKVTREDGGVSKAVVEKQKDGEGGLAWHFHILSEALGTDQDGDPITAGVPEFVDIDPAARRRRPTGQAKTAFDILCKLIHEIGERKPDMHGIPDGQVTVVEAEWRQQCISERLGHGEAEAEQKAFSRAVQSLESNGLIVRAIGYVWLAQTDGHSRQTPTNKGHVRHVHRTDTDIPLKGMSDVRDGDVMIDGYVGDDGHS